MKKVLIVDLYNMVHRARHSFIKGEYSTVFNFFRSFKSELERHSPTDVCIVSEGRPHHRYVINPEYKGTRVREYDASFSKQKKIILNLLKHIPVNFVQHNDFECDDVIGFLATEVYKSNSVIICSTDTDFIQLLEHDNVQLWNPIKKKFIDRFPVDYVVYKSLKGDSSDNVPGVRGIGEKRAMKLASSEKLMADFFTSNPTAEEQYKQSYKQIVLADISISDEILKFEVYNHDLNSLYNSFVSFNFKSLTGKAWQKWENVMESLNESRSKEAPVV